MSIKLFDDLRRERDALKERLEQQQYCHLELIAGIEGLSKLLKIERPSEAEGLQVKALVNRLIAVAKCHYDAMVAEDDAAAGERRHKGSNDR